MAEIRDMVYQELFLCSVPVVPGYIHHTHDTGRRYYPRKWYRYQYDNGREKTDTRIDKFNMDNVYGQNIVPSRYSQSRLPWAWITKPTGEQEELIAEGELELPPTIDETTGLKTEHHVLKGDSPEIQIINKRVEAVSPIRGISFLLTCKQIHNEGSKVLYGGNTFVFDARGDACHGYPWSAEEKAKFRQTRWRIPGLPHPNGQPQTERETAKAIEQLFKQGWQPKVIYEDSFFRFCNIVGRENIASFTKVKIEGHFRTARREYTNPAGLARLLPLYTTVLKSVCLDLRNLSLHMGTETRFLYMGRGMCLTTGATPEMNHRDGKIHGAKKDEDIIDKTIERLVRDLPSFLKLQLGDYKTSMPAHDMKWGKARYWVNFVNKRGGHATHFNQVESNAGEDEDRESLDNQDDAGEKSLAVLSSIFGGGRQ